MNAPDTIYIAPNHESIIYSRGWFELRHADTDIAYVRADISYELAKTVEAQKAEIARLIKALNRYGEHSPECTRFGPGAAGDECTCGFTAALASQPAASDCAHKEVDDEAICLVCGKDMGFEFNAPAASDGEKS